jgi:prophage antirepressor-like protein
MSSQESICSFLPLHYDGCQIRTTVDPRGMFWSAAKDICAILGIANHREAMTRLDDDEKRLVLTDTPGGAQDILMVNEPGLYTLILGSRKPEAKAFKRWVTHDILPTLRQTGAYVLHTAPPVPVQQPDQLSLTSQLPPLKPRVKEHAEISLHLVAVWRVLRDATTALDNRDIAQLSGVGERTTRAHTRYLLQLGFLDVYETFPRHLYVITQEEAIHQSAYWQRLERIAAIFEARHRLTYEELQLLGKEAKYKRS